jgi:predicted ATPase
VANLLAETRVVTLTGSGGCGKTRLTMVVSGNVAARLLEVRARLVESKFRIDVDNAHAVT